MLTFNYRYRKQLHRGWAYFQARGFGFPRFKKYGQFKSLLFPQFKENPITGFHLKLPKIGAIPINLHRPIPNGFTVKQVRILRKADRWYASINIQCNVSVPDPMPHGHPIGVDIGLSKFLATSDGVLVPPPKFFKKLQSKLQLLQRRLSRKQKRSHNKDLSIRVHNCLSCGYTTDRDVASGQVIRNRGIELISTPGLGEMETACADDLPGAGATQSRQVSKSPSGITRKAS
jgi:transposase